MNNPKVCVAMPVYNGEATIELALNSLIAQTYKNWECVIVNDGSTDKTRQVLDGLTDSRFKVIHLEKNVGRGAARQVCLDHAEGDYLAYLDADDFYHVDKLKKQVDILLANENIDLVATALLSYDKSFNPTMKRGGEHAGLSFFKDGDNLPIVMPSVMIKLKGAKMIKYNLSLNAGEDIDYFSRYLNGKYYYSLDEVLYYWYTEMTTIKKVLEYRINGMKRAFYSINRSKIYALNIFFSNFFKMIVFGVLSPILGVDFFVKRRGSMADESQKKEYYKQLSVISKYKINNKYFNP